MARVWPHAVNCNQYYLQEEDLHVDLPPFDEQERLLGLYFTYAHPVFPVVHKGHLMSLFYARCVSPVVTFSSVLPPCLVYSNDRYISKMLTSPAALTFEPVPAHKMRAIRLGMLLVLHPRPRLVNVLHRFPSYCCYPFSPLQHVILRRTWKVFPKRGRCGKQVVRISDLRERF